MGVALRGRLRGSPFHEAGMVNVAQVIFDCPLDTDTQQVIRELRKMRIEVARKQLAEFEKTYQSLSKGPNRLKKDDLPNMKDFKALLEQKLQALEARIQSDALFADELEFYINLLGDQSNAET